MTKQTIFKQAHKEAKTMVRNLKMNYRAAFTQSLKGIYTRIAQRNSISVVKATFIAKDIKEEKIIRKDRLDYFRKSMLKKYDLAGKKTPYVVGCTYL